MKFQKSFLGFGFMLFAAIAAQASEGSGYNGPDLNPISIPVALDRGISIPAIESAIATCMVTGDAKLGLKSVTQHLFEQMGFELQSSGIQNFNVNSTSSGATPVNSFSFEGYLIPTSNSVDTGSNYIYQTQDHTLQFQLGIGSGGPTMLQPSDSVFPYVTYASVLQDGGYDAFGNPDLTQEMVSGLMVQVGPTFAQSGTAMPLVNQATKQISSFTVNAQEYVQCLQSELQLQANSQPNQ